MADATAVPTVVDSWFDGKRQHVVGTIAVGASPLTYAAGGIVMSFNVASMPGVAPGPPVWVVIKGVAGFIYAYAAGTTSANGKLQAFAETTVATNQPLLEFTTTAVSAAFSGDTITFYAIFKLR